MKKNQTKDRTVICTNLKRPKIYEVSESKDNPGFVICPACGEYHKISKKEQ